MMPVTFLELFDVAAHERNGAHWGNVRHQMKHCTKHVTFKFLLHHACANDATHEGLRVLAKIFDDHDSRGWIDTLVEGAELAKEVSLEVKDNSVDYPLFWFLSEYMNFKDAAGWCWPTEESYDWQTDTGWLSTRLLGLCRVRDENLPESSEAVTGPRLDDLRPSWYAPSGTGQAFRELADRLELANNPTRARLFSLTQ